MTEEKKIEKLTALMEKFFAKRPFVLVLKNEDGTKISLTMNIENRSACSVLAQAISFNETLY